jgi:subtilisin-like proprotein convertase family protein
MAFAIVAGCILGSSRPVSAGGPPGCAVLCIAVDGSGSITASNFNLIKSGLSSAIRDASVVPRDGSLFLSVVQFGTDNDAQVEAPLTFIDSDAAANDVANKVDAMVYGDGGTPIDAGINLCAQTLFVGACNISIINVVTDGEPDSAAAAVAARENAVNNMGVTEVNAEAVQAPEAAVAFLRDQLVWPQPGYLAPPFQGNNGFVVNAPTFNEFGSAIRAKLGRITGTNPGEGCQIFMSTDVPKTIPDLGMASSTVNVTAVGLPSSISIVDLHGNHSFMEDLEIHLTSPLNTDVIVFMQACGDSPGFNFSLDSRASILTPCPADDGMRHRPSNPLTVFNGQNPAGIWRLDILDKRPADFGDLQGWGIEVCYPPPTTDCQSQTSTGPSQPIVDFGMVSSTINVTATGPLTSVSIPNMTGSHTFMEDLDIVLRSPLGTEVLVFDQACSDDQGFNFGLSDSSADADPCPPNDGQIHRPSNPFSAFAGEEAAGPWTLQIFDRRAFDEGALDHWTIEVCFGDSDCIMVQSTDVPKTIPDLSTAHSEIEAPFVDVTDPNEIFYRVQAQGSHTFFEDLRFRLTSAQGTQVLLTDQKCSNYSGPFNITWDDNAPGNSPCPPDGALTRPEQSFVGTINGELPGGTWSLDVEDIRGFDSGVLDHWKLEICTGPTTPDCRDNGIPYGAPFPAPWFVENTSGPTADFVVTIDFPPGLTTVPGSCVTPKGTCTLMPSNTTLMVTLTPGERVDFDHDLQLSPSVPQGTELCADFCITRDGGPPQCQQFCDTTCTERTPTPTPTHTQAPTFTHTPSRTHTPQPTFTPTRTHTFAPTHTPSRTPTGTRPPTFTPTRTATPTLTFTRTFTHSPTHTHSPTVTPTHTRPPKPTFTPTWTPTVTDTETPTPTEFATATPTETFTEAPTETPTFTPTGTLPATFTPTLTATSTSAATATPSATATDTRRMKPTFTPTDTPTATETPTPTATGPTATPTVTPTGPTATATATGTPEPTRTPTPPLGPGDPCDNDFDCTVGFCVDGVCCETETCPEGQRCDLPGREGMCMTPGLGDPCPAVGPCAVGFCVDGVCCEAETCPAGQRCDTAAMPGECLPPRIGDPCTGPGTCAEGFCVDGFCCSSGSCPEGQRCNIPGSEGDCTPTGIGSPCTDTGDCFEGTCVDNTCCETPSCPAGERCDIFGSDGMCVPPAAAGQPCADSLDCQDGFVCRFSTLRLQNLCTPEDGSCSCVGDCNCDGAVTVDSIVTMVSIALGILDPPACLMGDANLDGMITVDEIITAVNNALDGCPAPPPTPTPTITPSPTPT